MEAISAIRFFIATKSSGRSKEKGRNDLVVEICTREEFHAMLVREKERADRNGHGFSLVTVDTSAEKDPNSLVVQLRNRMRLTDEIGWFDHHTLGVFLYNTPAVGAWKFIDKSRNKQNDCLAGCDYSVYSYPKEWCSC